MSSHFADGPMIVFTILEMRYRRTCMSMNYSPVLLHRLIVIDIVIVVLKNLFASEWKKRREKKMRYIKIRSNRMQLTINWLKIEIAHWLLVVETAELLILKLTSKWNLSFVIFMAHLANLRLISNLFLHILFLSQMENHSESKEDWDLIAIKHWNWKQKGTPNLLLHFDVAPWTVFTFFK